MSKIDFSGNVAREHFSLVKMVVTFLSLGTGNKAAHPIALGILRRNQCDSQVAFVLESGLNLFMRKTSRSDSLI